MLSIHWLIDRVVYPPVWPFPTFKGKPYKPEPKPQQPYPGDALV